MDELHIIGDTRITSFGRLLEANAKLTHLLGHGLQAECDLPLTWYGVLLHIGRAGGVRPIGELIAATAFTSGGVTRLVDRMEQAGLLERRPCPTDRRVQYVALTDAGRTRLAQATVVHLRGIQQHMLDALKPDEVVQLDNLLAKIGAWDGNNG